MITDTVETEISLAVRSTPDTPSRPLATGTVMETGTVVLDDSVGILAEPSILLEYARAALENDLDDATFLFEHPVEGHVRVWIERPLEAPIPMREVTVLPAGDLFGLTHRELQVLTILTGGLGNPDIAAVLGIRPKTVDSHVARVLLKLDQSNRSGAAAIAAEQGLISLPLPPSGANALLGLTAGLLHRAATMPQSGGKFVATRANQFRRPVVRRRPLLIGSIIPSHPDLADAEDMRCGGALAVEEINRRGGIRGRQAEQLIVETDVWSHEAMMSAVRRLAEEGVDALVFGYTVDLTRVGALLEQAGSHGFPVLHTCTSAAAIEVVRDNPQQLGSVFQLCGVDEFYGTRFFNFITNLRGSGQWKPEGRRVAVLDGYAGMRVCSDEVANRADDQGWDVSRIARMDLGDPDVSLNQILDRIDALEPSALLLSTFLEERLLLAILERLARHESKPLAYALYTPSLAGFPERAGELGEGLVWATVTGRYRDRIGASFSQSFADAYGRLPGMGQAGIQYDAVNLLARAWSRSSHPRHFGEVCDTLRHEVHRGVDGVYFFGNPGQTALTYPDNTQDPSLGQAHLIYQIQDGRHNVIAPSPYADSTFQSTPALPIPQAASLRHR